MPAEPLPSSGVVPEARSCDTADLVMIHRFIRTMFLEASGLVEQVRDGDRRRAQLVVAHLNASLLRHLGQEEAQILPAAAVSLQPP